MICLVESEVAERTCYETKLIQATEMMYLSVVLENKLKYI